MTRRSIWVNIAAVVLAVGCRGGAVAPSAAPGARDGEQADPCARRLISHTGHPCCTPGGVVGEVPGTTCDSCVGPEGLACRGCPGERPGVTCYLPQPDGGAYGHCIADGQEIEGKVIGAYCCNRATPASRGTTIPSQLPGVVGAQGADARGCIQVAPVSVQICAHCGDAVCAPWENWCNCPADCPAGQAR